MTQIELSADEVETIKAYAEQKDCSFDEAAEDIFRAGVEELLNGVSPSTMAIKRIMRDSKRTLS